MGAKSLPQSHANLESFLSDPDETRFFDYHLERIWTTWRGLYRNESPTLSGPVCVALDRQAEELASLGTIPRSGLSAMRSMASAGYFWRLAEETTVGAEQQDAEYLARWTQIMESRPPQFSSFAEVTRERFLFWGATELVSRSQESEDASLAWAGCRRGVLTQLAFFSAALGRTSEVVVPESDIDASIRPSFVFGLGLRDTERWLDSQKLDGAAETIVGEAIRSMETILEDKFGDRSRADDFLIGLPTWVAWQSSKAEVARVARVLDQKALDALSAQYATEVGSAAEQRARVRYDAELDRVIREGALGAAVERVHSAVFHI